MTRITWLLRIPSSAQFALKSARVVLQLEVSSVGMAARCAHKQRLPHRCGDCGFRLPLAALAVPEVTHVQIPGFSVSSVAGVGGFATAYRGTRIADARPTVIKVARADTSEALRNERTLLARVGPEHAPTILGSGMTADGLEYLALEDLGAAASAMLLEPDSLGYTWAFAANALALVRGVAAIHRAGIIHLDLKPENLFLRAGGDGQIIATLIDFGLGRELSADEPTASRTLRGSAEYMAPEQCRPGDETDKRSDIYSTGVVLFELLCGRVPFFGAPADVWQAHLSRRPSPPVHANSIPSAMTDLVLRCLSKSPADRYADGDALACALESVFSEADFAEPAASPNDGLETVAAVAFRADDDPNQLAERAREGGATLAYSSAAANVAVFPDASMEAFERARGLSDRLVGAYQTTALVLSVRIKIRKRKSGGDRILSGDFPGAGELLASLEASGAYVAAAVASRFGLEAGADGETAVALQATSAETRTHLPDLDGACLGRDRLLRSLLASAKSAFELSMPTMTEVVGDAGIGKTLVASTVARALEEMPGVQTLSLSVENPTLTNSDQVFVAFLKAAFDVPTNYSKNQVRHAIEIHLGGTLAAEVWRGIAAVFDIEDSRPERAVHAAPGALRTASVRGLGECLRRLATERPLAIVLDNAHSADQRILDAIEYATSAEMACRIWVCTFTPRELRDSRPTWGSLAERNEKFRLGPLPAEAAIELCRLLLAPAEDIPASTIERLVARADGVPSVLVETCRALHQRGAIHRHEKGENWYVAQSDVDSLPSSAVLEALAGREIAVLSPALEAHAALFAVLGGDFELDEARGVTETVAAAGAAAQIPLDCDVALEQLSRAEILVRPTGESGFAFRHPLLVGAILARAAPLWLYAIHRSAYAFFSQLVESSERDVLARRAKHAAAVDLAAEACEHYLELAARAVRRHSYEQAARFYRAVLDSAPPSAINERLVAHRGRGMMLYRVGRYEESLGDLDRAIEIAKEIRDRKMTASILLDKATALDWLDEFDRSAATVEKAISLLEAPLDTLLEARTAMSRGRTAWRKNDREAAAAQLEAAIRFADSAGTAAAETRTMAMLMLGTIYSQQGKMELAEPIFVALADICEANGDRIHLCATLCNRRYVWIARGDLTRIAEDAERAAKIGRELGWAFFESMTRMNTAEVYMWAGDLVAARSFADRAIEVERRISARLRCHLLEPRLLRYEGKLDECREAMHRLREIDREAKEGGGEGAGFTGDEENLLRMLALALGEATPRDWDELCEQTIRDDFDQEALEVLEAYAQWQQRNGDIEGAHGSLQRALEIAETIPNVAASRIGKNLAGLRDEDASG